MRSGHSAKQNTTAVCVHIPVCAYVCNVCLALNWTVYFISVVLIPSMQHDLHVCRHLHVLGNFLLPLWVVLLFLNCCKGRPVVAHLCGRVYTCGWVCVLSDVQPMTPQGGEAEGRPVCTWLITPTSKCVRNHLPTNSINFTFPCGHLQATQRPFRSPIKRRDIWIWALVNLFTYVLSRSLLFFLFDFCALGVPFSTCTVTWERRIVTSGRFNLQKLEKMFFFYLFKSVSRSPFQSAWFYLRQSKRRSCSNVSWH